MQHPITILYGIKVNAQKIIFHHVIFRNHSEETVMAKGKRKGKTKGKAKGKKPQE